MTGAILEYLEHLEQRGKNAARSRSASNASGLTLLGLLSGVGQSRRRAKMERRKTRRIQGAGGFEGEADCRSESRAAGSRSAHTSSDRFAARFARVICQMQARQERRYPADAVSRRRWRMQGAGGQAAASGCGTTSPKKDEGRAAERDQGDMRGRGRGRSRADRSRARRVAQDCDPKLYMYTASGRMDAQIARPAQGARLPRPRPHAGQALKTTRSLRFY